jgi:hypothetical protein
LGKQNINKMPPCAALREKNKQNKLLANQKRCAIISKVV